MRRLTINGLLVLTSILVTIVTVDLVLLGLHGPVRMRENFYEPAAHFGYRMIPNSQFVFANPYRGYSATIRTNSRGLRGDEVTIPKPSDTFRILLIGDSMTAGLEVNRDNTFEAVCEERLSRFGDVQIINAGVRGYNIDNVLAYLEWEGLSFRPDVVIYLFVDNDLADTPEPAPLEYDRSKGFTIAGVMGRLATYSHILYRVEILRQTSRIRRQHADEESHGRVAFPGGFIVLFGTRDDQHPMFVETQRRVERMAELCKLEGALFAVGCAPQRDAIDPEIQDRWVKALRSRSVDPDFDGGRSFIARSAEASGCELFDVIPAFRRELISSDDFWFYQDGHLNEQGHALLGGELENWIEALPRFQRWKSDN